jgi:flagellar FliJ protein
MKRFRFRLDALLKFRHFLMRQAQLELAKAHTEVLDCEARILQCRARYAEAARKFDEETFAGITARRLLRLTDYLEAVDREIASESQRRRMLLKTLAEKQRALARRSVDRKVMENLKDRQKEAYYSQMMRSEQKAADETVILRQDRKVGS